MSFREEASKRNWIAKNVATHFLMDGGKLNIPDEQAGQFLNVYFTHAVIKKENLSVVELKTPRFKLFFDIDVKFPKGRKKDCLVTLQRISETIRSFLKRMFFCDSVDMTAIACVAPSKPDKDGDEKYGVHLIFPNCIVNSPIAASCRDALVPYLEDEFRASSSSDVMPLNKWPDIIDDSVFKANGLRMIWSSKGKYEKRQYQPYVRIDDSGVETYSFSDIAQKRDVIRDTSIRTFDMPLSACLSGEHDVQVSEKAQADVVVGTSTSVDMYGSVLQDIRSVLPPIYKDVIFTAAFVTSYAVMLKTNSRYCQNKGGEHRTSTIYFCVTKQGVSQRCYCRKDTNTCDKYASAVIPLPERILREFFPDFLDDDDVRVQMRKPVKRRLTNIDSILKRTRLLKKN